MRSHEQETEQGMKRILVKFVGGTKEPQEVMIGPGTTAADLLGELKLDKTSFFVSKGSADSIFGADEPLYPTLEDGALVYVSSRVDAGN